MRVRVPPRAPAKDTFPPVVDDGRVEAQAAREGGLCFVRGLGETIAGCNLPRQQLRELPELAVQPGHAEMRY